MLWRFLLSWLAARGRGAGVILLLLAGIASVRSAEPRASEDYLVEHWTSEQGLPQNTIVAMHQDRDGLLWLGTFGGLARFDGLRFEVFDTSNTPALRSERIVNFLADPEEGFWIFSEEGLVTRYRRGRFEAANGQWGLPPGPAFPIGGDPDGKLIVGMGGVPYLWNGSAFAAQPRFPKPESYAPEFVVTVRGRAWVRTGERWVLMDHTAMAQEFRRQGYENVQLWNPAPGGDFWAISSERIWQMRAGKTIALSHPFPREEQLHSFLQDPSGVFWAGALRGGLFVIQPDGEVRKVPLNLGDASLSVRSLMIDLEGNLWAAMDTAGLVRVTRRKFQNFTIAHGLRGAIVKSVAEAPDGRIWVAHQFGIDGIRPDGSVEKISNLENPWTLGRTPDGFMWVGQWGGGITRFEGEMAATCHLEGPSSRIRAMGADRSGNIWAGTMDGPMRVDGTNITRVPVPVRGSARPLDVRAIVEDRKGRLYLGANGSGLHRREGEGDRWRHFGRAEGLADDTVRGLYVDTNEVVWIGTATGGLHRFEEGSFFQFPWQALSLPRDVAGVGEDDLGYLWLTSGRGIYRVKRAELDAYARGASKGIVVARFDRSDGLGTSECAGGMQPTIWKGRDGRMWFATIQGVSVTDPAQLPANNEPLRTLIDDLIVDGRKQPRELVQAGSAALRIPPGAGRVEMRFTALSLAFQEKAQFKYRLRGLDDRWSEPTRERSASFQKLRPGNYTFEVTACNPDGVWNPVPATLSISALPFVWQTGWFQATTGGALALAIIGLVRFVSQMRLRERIQRLENAAQVDAERARIAKDMHDDLGANLTQIGLLATLAARGGGEGRHLQKIADTAVETVTRLDEIVWAANPRHDTLDSLVTYISYYASDYLAATSVRFRQEIPPALPARKVSAETRHNLFLAVKEALNNMAKHAGAQQLRLIVAWDNPQLTLALADDGKGFDIERADPLGNGLGNIRRRVESAGGSVLFTSAPGRGTEVRIVISFPEIGI
jgi:signal transduction histidine kinase/ligand-binding sensor domain-containing protein